MFLRSSILFYSIFIIIIIIITSIFCVLVRCLFLCNSMLSSSSSLTLSVRQSPMRKSSLSMTHFMSHSVIFKKLALGSLTRSFMCPDTDALFWKFFALLYRKMEDGRKKMKEGPRKKEEQIVLVRLLTRTI